MRLAPLAFLSCLFAVSAHAESVLIFGSTGHTGSRITKILHDQGHAVTAFVRPSSNRERLGGLDVKYAVGDVLEPDTVVAAFEKSKPEIVIAVMQSRPTGSPHGDPEVALVELAEQSGSAQFIYLSSVGAGPDTEAQRTRYPDINFDIFAAGLAEKAKVERALMESSLSYTIIRSGSILVEFGRPPPPGTGRGYFTEDEDVTGPITYDDLAILMARCAGSSGCNNKIYHATDDTLGPEYNHWRCRRFAARGNLAAACDHLRPIKAP